MPLFLSLALLCGGQCAHATATDGGDLHIMTKAGNDRVFHIELATSAEDQRKGLMFRYGMAADHGMLFLFEHSAFRSFWMKNTYIPLDMIFIREDGTIHKIHENAQPHDLTNINSDGAVKAVLELPGGTAAANGLSVGDVVRCAVLGNAQADAAAHKAH